VGKNQKSDLTLSDFPKVGPCTSFNYRVRDPIEALPGFEGPASAYPPLALWLLSGRQKRFILCSVVVRKEQGKETSEKQQNKNKKQERDTQKKRSLEERSTRRVLRRERERISRMSGVGRKKGILEVFKFATYVTIPIVMMSMFANNTENLDRIIRNRAYVVYPPEGPRPPSGDEIREMVKKNKTVS